MSGADLLGDKVAIVTGGASGIGRATAILFATEGASVCIADIDSAGSAVADEIVAAGGRAEFVRADMTQEADCARVVESAVAAFDGLDVLFNNAGIIVRASVLDSDQETWDRLMNVNAKSVYLASRQAIPVMQQGGGGSIVNNASGWGLAGGPRAAAYCASKGAVVQLTRAMAIDHGPDNIRVNCICPGDTDTPMLRSEAAALGEPEEPFLARAAQRPLRRIAAPREIAQAALYLASDAASFVTGAALVVDGGGRAGV